MKHPNSYSPSGLESGCNDMLTQSAKVQRGPEGPRKKRNTRKKKDGESEHEAKKSTKNKRSKRCPSPVLRLPKNSHTEARRHRGEVRGGVRLVRDQDLRGVANHPISGEFGYGRSSFTRGCRRSTCELALCRPAQRAGKAPLVRAEQPGDADHREVAEQAQAAFHVVPHCEQVALRGVT